MIKKLVTCVLICIVIYNLSICVYADTDGDLVEVGIECIGDYSEWDDLDDLSSPIYIANDIYSAFRAGNAKGWRIQYMNLNNMVRETDFKGKSLGGYDHFYADDVDLLFYSGHGLSPNATFSHGAKVNSLAMNNQKNSYYAKQNQMYLGNQDLEWFVTFTCNFLNASMDEIGSMAKGVHCICGMETGVYLYPTQGKIMSDKLKRGISVKEAYFATLEETAIFDWGQKQTAAVFTTRSCANDRIWGYGTQGADPESYSNNKSIYIKYRYTY